MTDATLPDMVDAGDPGSTENPTGQSDAATPLIDAGAGGIEREPYTGIYTNGDKWACRPGLPNPCEAQLAVTELLLDGLVKLTIAMEPASGDDRDNPVLWKSIALADPAVGLHSLDYAFVVDELVDAARVKLEAWIDRHR